MDALCDTVIVEDALTDAVDVGDVDCVIVLESDGVFVGDVV